MSPSPSRRCGRPAPHPTTAPISARCSRPLASSERGDLDDWLRSWRATAERVHQLARTSLAAGHRVSARQAFLRASDYYRTAEFFRRDMIGQSICCTAVQAASVGPIYWPRTSSALVSVVNGVGTFRSWSRVAVQKTLWQHYCRDCATVRTKLTERWASCTRLAPDACAHPGCLRAQGTKPRRVNGAHRSSAGPPSR